MPILTLYLSTAAVFLFLDAVMLALVMKPLFLRHIAPLMLDNIRVMPALLFYAAYVAGLVYLVSYPAMKSGGAVLLPAIILGAMAYGTYEFTNYAILRDWHWSMVVVDVAWGGVLTGFAAWAGLAITRALGQG